MWILVINCGSSSIKADVLDARDGRRRAKARVERLGSPDATLSIDGAEPEPCDGQHHASALAQLLPRLLATLGDGHLAGVGHRVVHGGEAFGHPTRIDDTVIAAIEATSPLAPLHNPANLAGIRAARTLLPELPHVAVFDTAFHSTLPRRARCYALPDELVQKHGIRRYGFHGTSHAYVAQRAADFLGEDLRALRIITCHLGNGCSACAVEYGRSVETSMGMTPLEGLVMGTRSGDVDAGVLLDLLRRGEADVEGLDQILNKRSGLAGLSGHSNDMRDIEERAGDGDEAAQRAIHVFTHRLRKYIGAYAAIMGGVDAIVFTGGIGQNSALIRHRAAQRLEFLGARLSETANREGRVDADRPVAELSTPHSRVKILAIATDEEHEIARQTAVLVAGHDVLDDTPSIPIKVSARHIHLTKENVAKLFGEGYELTPRKPLGQPGQWVAEERLNLIGPKRRIDRVGIIGPCRSKNQVEISRTDEFWLGIDAPIRRSGDVANSAALTLEGPAGTVHLEEGVICAARHIHMTPEDAKKLGVADRDVVEVAVDTEGRDLVFGDVLVRVSPKYTLEMHIDTDEANAAEIRPGEEGMLMVTSRKARMTRRGTRFDRATT